MDVWTLENDVWAITVAPQLGARIDAMVDKRRGKDWLWHPPGYAREARFLDVGASYDDHWTGGWDDIFPNDAAGEALGRRWAHHGELWSQAWDVTQADASRIAMRYRCRTVPVTVEKTVALDPGAARFTVTHVFRNESDEDLPYLFKLHPALVIEAGDRILLPPCRIAPVDLGFSRVLGRQEWTAFPKGRDAAGREVAVDLVPDPWAEGREFFYARDLAESWCGLRDGRGDVLRFSFDRAAFPYVWVFASYGGWNGHRVLVLEPAATMPWDLTAAVAQGTCAVLPRRSAREATVTVSLEPATPT